MGIFVGIDVETANQWPGSICQIGLVSFSGGKLIRESWLVNPQRPFARVNKSIHGLSEDQCASAPVFQAIHPKLMEEISGQNVVCYTDFDARAIGSACLESGLPYPESVWIDACAAARAAWPELPSHALRAVGQHLGLTFKNEKHDAAEDAVAAAYVFMQAIKRLGLTTETAAPHFAIREAKASLPPATISLFGRFAPKKFAHGDWVEALLRHTDFPPDLVGHTVVFTGASTFSREVMAARVLRLGARVTGAISKKTTIVVSGWKTPADGATKLKAAGDLNLKGCAIICLRADDFEGYVSRLEG